MMELNVLSKKMSKGACSVELYLGVVRLTILGREVSGGMYFGWIE